jgi:hypothetical protein
MTISQRHHYIPEFIIKGFVGDDNKLSVYNIEKDQLEEKRKSPKQIFFEWNRNTFNVNGEDTDLVERLYQYIENQFAPLHKKIVESNGKFELKPLEIYQLAFYLGFIYYRLPFNDNEIRSSIKDMTNKDLLFKIVNTNTLEDAPIDRYKEIMNNPAFIESSRIILSIKNYLKSEVFEEIENWLIYFSGGEIKIHILSDNPFIFKMDPDPNIFKCEFIYPFSKGSTIFHIKGNTINELPPEHRVKLDILTFLQAKKVVCGPDGSYLKVISNLAKQFNTTERINKLKENVFGYFE